MTKKLLIGAIIFSQSFAFAETFRSFEFHDRSLNNRADIVDIIPNLYVNVSKQEQNSVEKISLKKVDLFFFKEISNILNTANNPSKEKWSALAPEKICQVHKSISSEVLSEMIKFDSSVNAKNIYEDCQSAYQPELYINDFNPAIITRKNVNNIPGLVQLIADPFKQVSFAANLITPELLKRMRLVLTKIRMQELLSDIKNKKKLYEHIFNKSQSAELKQALSDLHYEISVAETYLLKIDSQGRQQAQLDRAKVEKSGRIRADLPYENLTDEDREFITTYISAAMWRFRGGGVVAKSDSTQWRRIHYTWISTNVLGALNGGEKGARLGGLMYIRLLKMWGRYFDMGRNPVDEDETYDLTKMTERGVFQVKSVVASLDRNGYSSTAMSMAGLQMGPCYYFMFDQNMPRLKYDGRTNGAYLGVYEGETDWGESCVGAAMGIGLSRSLLQGYDPKKVIRTEILDM